jgi:hypothetical protein
MATISNIIATLFGLVAAYFLRNGLAEASCQVNSFACFYGFIIFKLIPLIVLVFAIVYWYNQISEYLE